MSKITKQKLELINEQTSPLFRAIWVHNITEPTRRKFGNNICAFHIGGGFVLSVAHNLRAESGVLLSIDDSTYSTEILPHLNPTQTQLFNQCYPLDATTHKRYVNIANPTDAQTIIEALKQVNFDTRWLTLMQRKICTPYLIVQFRKNQFYESEKLTSYFDSNTYFPEPFLNRHTFLLELKLVDAYYSEDFSLYKIVNTEKAIIDRLPSIEVDFSLLEDNHPEFYCIQSSPHSEVGRLLNKAQIEGFLDHHGIFQDRIGGNYTFEETRYLIKGYFRFGSSGAPYVFYDPKKEKFKVNAIQSEACPIQLSINNNRDGNFQYINAIASPLINIKKKVKNHI